MLPIQVEPIRKDVIYQVLEKYLTDNIILGRPWIHGMQVVPSTYHKCLKFPCNGQEITILANSHMLQYCNTLQIVQYFFMPHNREALASPFVTLNNSIQLDYLLIFFYVSSNQESQPSSSSTQPKKTK